MNKTGNLEGAQQMDQTELSAFLLVRHLNAFIDNDLDALMLDYTDQSIFITQEATHKGRDEIKLFFTILMVHFPKGKSKFELDKMIVKDDLGFIVWHANTPSLAVPLGTDTFIIREGKISRQTFLGKMDYIDAAALI